jgi:nicotinamide-nucleotide amidase
MKAEIIAVGTELLTPDFQDTNSLQLAAGLGTIGLGVGFKTIVGDDARDLSRALRTALARSRLILCMGGLGPTEDDRTRETLAKVLKRRLVFREAIRAGIRERFSRRGLAMPASNLKQCSIIAGSEILDNPNGTAPGLWLETKRNMIALLPGPPREALPMFERQVLPRLTGLGRGLSVRRVIRITGLGESSMEMLLKPVYRAVPPGVTVTTLAASGDLSIHLTYRGMESRERAEALIDGLDRAISRSLGPWIYSRNGESLEEVVGALLVKNAKTIACAESCTGGLIGHRLTNVPGSSAYFLESAVVYSNGAKTRRLGVPASFIDAHGAVSGPVAGAMAVGVRMTSKAAIGVAVTGIAGPGGGTPRKPVGLVYIALADARGVTVRRHLFFGDRAQVKFQSSQKALDMVRKRLTPRPGKVL